MGEKIRIESVRRSVAAASRMFALIDAERAKAENVVTQELRRKLAQAKRRPQLRAAE